MFQPIELFNGIASIHGCFDLTSESSHGFSQGGPHRWFIVHDEDEALVLLREGRMDGCLYAHCLISSPVRAKVTDS